jgi:hypothetical protein
MAVAPPAQVAQRHQQRDHQRRGVPADHQRQLPKAGDAQHHDDRQRPGDTVDQLAHDEVDQSDG